MKRFLAALLCSFIATASIAIAQASSGSGVISQAFSLSGTGYGPMLVLNGQSTCSIVITSGASFTVVPQASSDGPVSPQTWNTVSTIGAGSITALGTQTGNIAGSGITNFRFNVTALGTGPLTGVESCSPAAGGTAASGGGTATPAYTRIQDGTSTSLAGLIAWPSGSDGFSPGVTTGLPTQAQMYAQGAAGLNRLIGCDNSAVINATATAQIIAASGAKTIYVCGFSVTAAGTTPTLQFEYGTGSTCGTGTTTLTGTYAPTSGTFLSFGNGLGTIFRTPASQALCIVLGGSSPSVQGVLTYAQF